jgi:hypothetical protein
MADITITAANVVATNSATVKASGTSGTSAVASTAGMPVYLDPADGKIKPAKADSASSVPPPNLVGVALDSAPGANQPITYATAGDVTYGGGLTQGQVYVVSAANAGGIAPYSDLVATNFVAFLGVAISTTVLRLGIIPASVQK